MQIGRGIRVEERVITLAYQNVKNATFHKQLWKSQIVLHSMSIIINSQLTITDARSGI